MKNIEKKKKKEFDTWGEVEVWCDPYEVPIL